MVRYLPSEASVQVTVMLNEVATVLTLTGPAEVTQGVAFTLTATLKRADTGAAIPGAELNLYRGSSTVIATGVTSATGVASFNIINNVSGVYTYTVKFAGLDIAGELGYYLPSSGVYSAEIPGGGIGILLGLGLAYMLVK